MEPRLPEGTGPEGGVSAFSLLAAFALVSPPTSAINPLPRSIALSARSSQFRFFSRFLSLVSFSFPVDRSKDGSGAPDGGRPNGFLESRGEFREASVRIAAPISRRFSFIHLNRFLEKKRGDSVDLWIYR